MSTTPVTSGPTVVAKPPQEKVIESTTIVARENTTSTIREVYRDSWLSDEQALRLNCINMACSVVEKPFLGKGEDDPGIEERVLAIAERFAEWIIDGDANTVTP